jgi:hypothetical protein
MAPIPPLIFVTALFVALLAECELWLLDGCWRIAPRETPVDFVICNGTVGAITADVCARLQGDAVRPEQEDDFDDE